MEHLIWQRGRMNKDQKALLVACVALQMETLVKQANGGEVPEASRVSSSFDNGVISLWLDGRPVGTIDLTSLCPKMTPLPETGNVHEKAAPAIEPT